MNVITIIVEKSDSGIVLKNWSLMPSGGEHLNPVEILQSLQMVSTTILGALNMAPATPNPKPEEKPKGGT